jgi:TolB protein
VAFIDTSAQGLRLYLDDLTDGEGPRYVLDQGPLWMDWSSDSRTLLVHRGPDHFLVDAETGVVATLDLDSDGLGYSVPAWRPTGDEITYVGGDRLSGYTVDRSNREADRQGRFGSVPRQAAFLWSPDGTTLAVTRPQRVLFDGVLGLRVFDRLSFFGADGAALPVEVRDNTVAFFWSPDSTKLAYVTQTGVPGLLRWMVLDVKAGTRYALTDFVPSVEQLTVFQFFDQYAHSHSIWSPDSTALVFAGAVPPGAVGVSTAQATASRIVVLPIVRFGAPVVIADGILGFWSPR